MKACWLWTAALALPVVLPGSARANDIPLESLKREFGKHVQSDEALLDRKAIYGVDDRLEVSDADVQFQQAARSVAALFSLSELAVGTRSGQWQLPAKPILSDLEWCENERFAQQTATARCTGFLMSSDLLVTSAHCVKPEKQPRHDGLACTGMAIVFDYAQPDQANGTNSWLHNGLNSSQVFFCDSIVDHFMDPAGADWSVIRLERSVQDRKPLPFFNGDRLPESSVMSVIGHPLGLPAKVSGNGAVLDQSRDGYFVTDLDTYAGNSGSPVLVNVPGVEGLQVAGILSRGDADFERVLQDDGQTCQLSRHCTDSSCSGEHVTRMSEVPARQELE